MDRPFVSGTRGGGMNFSHKLSLVQALTTLPQGKRLGVDNSDGEYTNLINTFPDKIINITPHLKK